MHPSQHNQNMRDSDGLNFNTLLGFLGEAYNEKLQVYNHAENDALTRFKNNYKQVLEGVTKPVNEKRTITKQDTFDNEYAFKSSNDSDSKNSKIDIDTLYERCFDIIPKEKRKELCLKKVTVPEPFDLTCYKNNRSNIFKSVQDENGNFAHPKHAKPVPAYVYLPLYECMKNQNENERKERIEERKKKLLATVKPFELSTSTSEVKASHRRHSHSLSDLRQLRRASNADLDTNRNKDSISTENRTARNIKANPFPKHLFDPKNRHALEVEKQLRQIRIKARAEELLKQSSLPFSGDRITKKWNSMISLGQEKRTDKEKDLHSDKRYFVILRPRSSSTCGHRFQKHSESEFNRLKDDDRPVEVVGEKIANIQSKKRSIMDYDRLCQKNTRTKPQVKESKPPQSTMQKKIALKVQLNEHLMNKVDIKAKLRESRKNDLRRMEEYTREIEEMKQRVSQRPLLIERQMMDSLRKSAQKKLNQGGGVTTFNSSQHSRRSSQTNSVSAGQNTSPRDHDESRDETLSQGTELKTES